MQILADRVIANATEAFSSFGEVTLFDGRELNPAMLKRADVLLIRSVTKVDADLLKPTPVKFVGTATAGIDHVNVASLMDANIAFASAPGCNANAVAEFIATSAVLFCVKENLRAEDIQVAIIGHGAVGTRVEDKLLSLGFACVLNDPIKARENKDSEYVSLDTALQAHIVTVHTPLTIDGPHPTHRLIDTSQIKRMGNCRLFINAARGGIANEAALAQRMKSDSQFNVQLDCWENEPMINRELIGQLFRASPHVAGHSIEARQNATAMLVESLRKWCRSKPTISETTQGSELKLDVQDLEAKHSARGGDVATKDSLSALAQLLGQCCPVDEINNAMLDLAEFSKENVAAQFDQLRRRFAARREFTAFQVPIEVSGRFAHNSLERLGFRAG